MLFIVIRLFIEVNSVFGPLHHLPEAVLPIPVVCDMFQLVERQISGDCVEIATKGTVPVNRLTIHPKADTRLLNQSFGDSRALHNSHGIEQKLTLSSE